MWAEITDATLRALPGLLDPTQPGFQTQPMTTHHGRSDQHPYHPVDGVIDRVARRGAQARKQANPDARTV